jgi:hypothetical protein
MLNPGVFNKYNTSGLGLLFWSMIWPLFSIKPEMCLKVLLVGFSPANKTEDRKVSKPRNGKKFDESFLTRIKNL